MVEPVLNPIWAWLVHGERPSHWALLGGALIIGATAAQAVVQGREGAGVSFIPTLDRNHPASGTAWRRSGTCTCAA